MTGRIERLRKAHDLTIQWTAFPLHPETPEQGRTLEELFAGRGVDIPEMLAHMKRTADDLGLPFGRRTMTYNSRRAQELGKWAEDQGRGEDFHREVFSAYFAHGRNIALMEVLRDVVLSIGLDGDQVETILREGRYQAAVDRDWRRSRQLGVTAVPTFHMGGRLVVGAHPYSVLEDLVKKISPSG